MSWQRLNIPRNRKLREGIGKCNFQIRQRVFYRNIIGVGRSRFSLESNSLSTQSRSVKEVDPTINVGNAHIASKLQAALPVLLGILANRVDFLEFDSK
jgi:hypothetical protein